MTMFGGFIDFEAALYGPCKYMYIFIHNCSFRPQEVMISFNHWNRTA